MNKKDKNREEIYKDMCARLLYEPMCRVTGDWFYDKLPPYDTPLNISILQRFKSGDCDVKLYLRELDFDPKKSMTYDEYGEYLKLLGVEISTKGDLIEFFLKHHFDHRFLIPIKLALKAKKGMYTT